eukprot:GHUV01024299.1.p2 GENE.GHUV01024299.1~~GHUV01024299.1.p2  ORF type:complete len:115 (+),score=23.16 GHUV01024299.1:155-499(+)
MKTLAQQPTGQGLRPQQRACRSRKLTAIRAQAEVPAGLNKYSSHITQPKSQGASQAMLYATGLKEEDMSKPQVGIASMWYEGNPCNMHLLKLAEEVKRGVVSPTSKQSCVLSKA